MRKRLWIHFLILTIAATVGISTAAIPDPEEKKGIPAGPGEAKYDLHNPTTWLEMGADLRFRMIRERARKLDNNITSDDRFWQRYRAPILQPKRRFRPSIYPK